MIERNPVLPNALTLPVFNKLKGKRIVLASASPRRKEILEKFGLSPEIVPSTFTEDLNHSDYESAELYAAATCSEKGVQVYEDLVLKSPEDPPDLVISADTVVVLPPPGLTILEKPRDKADQLNMLYNYNGRFVDVVTAVTIIQPQIANPGYSVQSLTTRSSVEFANCPQALLEAYVDSGEGLDRAGGFAVQGLGGMLIRRINGCYDTIMGFPGQAFFEWIGELTEEGLFLELD